VSSAVLVLTWNGGESAMRCLEAVAALDPAPGRVLVVDNASSDGTAAQVAARFPAFDLIRNPRNLGFAAGMNVGIKALLRLDAPPENIVLLNQDTLVDPGWLAAITAPLAENPRIAAVGCKIRYADGRIQHAGVRLDWPRAVARHIGWHKPDTGQHDAPCEAEYLTAAALALRAAALVEVGLFDEGFWPAYFEDIDLCWRLRRAGYLLRYEPRATLIHAESLSLRDALTRSAYYNRGRLRFVLKSYPLADLEGPFAAAERAFLAEHGHNPEGRALRYAYSESLAALPGIVAARLDLTPDPHPESAERLRDLLLSLRRELASVLHRRAAACAAELYNL
jgi:GT2 family glycosyltransferase